MTRCTIGTLHQAQKTTSLELHAARIESGSRGLSLDDAIVLALAVEVPLIQLLALTPDERIALSPKTVIDDYAVHDWLLAQERVPGVKFEDDSDRPDIGLWSKERRRDFEETVQRQLERARRDFEQTQRNLEQMTELRDMILDDEEIRLVFKERLRGRQSRGSH